MKDLGLLHYFLGIRVRRTQQGFFLHEQQYTKDILERASMLNCKPAVTRVDTKDKVPAVDGTPLMDKTLYRSINSALQYLTLTIPELAYAVQQACLHMHAPHDVHWSFIKRILRYDCGTTSHDILLRAPKSTALTAYTNADWAGCPDTGRPTSGFCVFLGDTLVSWSSKRQVVVSRSSAEAEYRGVANAPAECCWLRNLLSELQEAVHKASIIFCDNMSAVYLSDNPVHHKRTKHFELDIHFVREHTALGQLRVLHVPNHLQFADIMTKGLPTSLFEDFRDRPCIRSSTAVTEGGC
jgi:hypothetical protein